MIGVILCCHGEMGEGIRDAAELIVGPQTHLAIVGIRPGQGLDSVEDSLKASIQKLEEPDGVLVLTDLPGGTPCNVTTRLLKDNVEMITGFNLPMVVKLLMLRLKETDLQTLTSQAVAYGKQNIYSAQELLSHA